MGRADYFELGDYNAACSMCGRKRKASQMVRNWQGLYRCPSHNEARQPQDFVRATPDIMSVPWAQPQVDNFVYFCTLQGRSAVPGLAEPGCMIPGQPYGSQPVLTTSNTIALESGAGSLVLEDGTTPIGLET